MVLIFTAVVVCVLSTQRGVHYKWPIFFLSFCVEFFVFCWGNPYRSMSYGVCVCVCVVNRNFCANFCFEYATNNEKVLTFLSCFHLFFIFYFFLWFSCARLQVNTHRHHTHTHTNHIKKMSRKKTNPFCENKVKKKRMQKKKWLGGNEK